MDDLLIGSGLEHLMGSGIPEQYLANLTKAQKAKQTRLINKSKEDYEKGNIVVNRPKVSDTPTKRSSHTIRFENKYGFPITDKKKLKTTFPDTDIDTILSKGIGAYGSSGSRPNVSMAQWSYARLASVLTGGPSLRIDKNLVGPISLKKIMGKQMVGGISKAVGFVRKAMAKTKIENDGYTPPARYGYDFSIAKKLDKPSPFIQKNLGEVPADKIVKHTYTRTKPSDKTAEEKLRDEVHKFGYWGLTKDDFEEVNGDLVEKKHGLLWPPIYYKPTGSGEGCWGLRCCRYTKKGKEIPTAKKYEFIYFREQDGCDSIPNEPVKTPITDANPPKRIKNDDEYDEADEGEVVLDRYYARANTSRFDLRLKHRGAKPFFWWEENDKKKKRSQFPDDYMVKKPVGDATAKDIPVIVSANRALRGFMKSYIFGSSNYDEPAMNAQEERWGEHLSNLRRTDTTIAEAEESRMLRGRRGRRKTKEPLGKAKVIDFVPNERDKVEEGDKMNSGTIYRQVGTYKNTFDNTRWGYLNAEIALNKIDDRKTMMSGLMSVMASAIGCNELLIDELIKDPSGKSIDFAQIEKDASQVGYGNENGADLTYDKEDVPRLLKEAKANAD